MSDITVKILQGIREDIQGLRSELKTEVGGLRKEMHDRFELQERRWDRRFSDLQSELVEVRVAVKAIAAYKERDTIALADELHDVRKRLGACEERLGIQRG